VFLGDGRVEYKKKRDESVHLEKLGLQRIPCTSQFPIPDMAVISPNLPCNNTDTGSSQPNQAIHTHDFSYPCITCTSFSTSAPISLFLILNSTIIGEHIVKSSLCISPCHDHELRLSTGYTKYSMYRVQHTLSTVFS